MCHRTTCPTCRKPDWGGCGAHVDAVLRDVPADRRCRCREDGTRPPAPNMSQLISNLFGGFSR